MPRGRVCTEEEKALRRKQQQEHAEITRRAARKLHRGTLHVRQCWPHIRHLSIGLVMGDEVALKEARAFIDSRYPLPTVEEALGVFSWAVRKVRDEELCRDAFERALRLIEEEHEEDE